MEKTLGRQTDEEAVSQVINQVSAAVQGEVDETHKERILNGRRCTSSFIVADQTKAKYLSLFFPSRRLRTLSYSHVVQTKGQSRKKTGVLLTEGELKPMCSTCGQSRKV